MSEALVVVIQQRAAREIETIDAWWRANRGAAPDLFAVELEGIVAAIALMPTLGAVAGSERVRSVRRVLLPRSRYHLYYSVREQTLEVLAVWHAACGVSPDV